MRMDEWLKQRQVAFGTSSAQRNLSPHTGNLAKGTFEPSPKG